MRKRLARDTYEYPYCTERRHVMQVHILNLGKEAFKDEARRTKTSSHYHQGYSVPRAGDLVVVLQTATDSCVTFGCDEFTGAAALRYCGAFLL